MRVHLPWYDSSCSYLSDTQSLSKLVAERSRILDLLERAETRYIRSFYLSSTAGSPADVINPVSEPLERRTSLSATERPLTKRQSVSAMYVPTEKPSHIKRPPPDPSPAKAVKYRLPSDRRTDSSYDIRGPKVVLPPQRATS